jgi:hypothetical protein
VVGQAMGGAPKHDVVIIGAGRNAARVNPFCLI